MAKDKKRTSAPVGELQHLSTTALGVGFLLLLLAAILTLRWRTMGQEEEQQQQQQQQLLPPEQTWARFREKHPSEPLGWTLQHQYSSTPLLLRSVPVATNRTLHALLSGIQYPRIKVHSSRRVPFYDSQSPWADLSHSAAPPFVSLPPSDLGDFPFSKANPLSSSKSPGWWHITLTLAGQGGLKLVSLLAPGFFDSLGGQTAAEHRLWLAREGWTVLPHYDVTDNLYLQLRGSKTFLVASPEAAQSLALHPSPHPSWRQAQLELTSLPALRAATQGDARVRLWQVTLRAGDALYLPAYNFHCVETGPDSVSMNAWLPSEATAYASAQMRLVLPWSREASRQEKLVALGSVAAALFAEAQDVFGCPQADMRDQLLNRHNSLAHEGRWCGGFAEGSDEAVCTEPVHSGPSGLAASQAVQALSDLLQAKVELPAVRALLALDWLEEALDSVLGPQHSSPCSVIRFVDTCI